VSAADAQEILFNQRGIIQHLKIIDVTAAQVFRMLLRQPGAAQLQTLMLELGIPNPQ